MKIQIFLLGLVMLILSSCANNCASTPGYVQGYNGQCVYTGTNGYGYAGTTGYGYAGTYTGTYGTYGNTYGTYGH